MAKKMLCRDKGMMTALDAQHAAAMDRYNASYNNTVYRLAVGDNAARGVWLQDKALAVCGSPYAAIHLDDRFTDTELAFLALFV